MKSAARAMKRSSPGGLVGTAWAWVGGVGGLAWVGWLVNGGWLVNSGCYG